ncbi:MAG: 1-deoxy-D-xylulose-5-phosphate reductoisomerase [Clostridiales Family XIII bacterium]|jgi:1-deoxy-D-xylulose-5-phosphate reductoisomerase|nr:1-deoxy-D-xylulose-5-phosphate reductoisomerase [Clostridiales Family XIII bacterium]
MQKLITILGSTGSIGTQTLDIVRRNPDTYRVEVLTCGKRIDILRAQILEFLPRLVVVSSEIDADTLRNEFENLEVYSGSDGLLEAATQQVDIFVNALVGIAGLEPTVTAITSGNKYIALANKETLVTGGRLVMDLAKRAGAEMIPIDSEHSAIWQAMSAGSKDEVDKIILTASGGPFFGLTRDELKDKTPAQALKHPNWDMGSKISIDSATMMNKGFEVIEARWLFDLQTDQIDVVVHKESIIHSMVAYRDGSVIAQMGAPDMRVPISYAVSGEKRDPTGASAMDLIKLGTLTFAEPDLETFKCLDYAYKVLKEGSDSAPVVLNAANEVLVELYLQGRIGFLDIQDTIGKILDEHEPKMFHHFEEIWQMDEIARAQTRQIIAER